MEVRKFGRKIWHKVRIHTPTDNSKPGCVRLVDPMDPSPFISGPMLPEKAILLIPHTVRRKHLFFRAEQVTYFPKQRFDCNRIHGILLYESLEKTLAEHPFVAGSSRKEQITSLFEKYYSGARDKTSVAVIANPYGFLLDEMLYTAREAYWRALYRSFLPRLEAMVKDYRGNFGVHFSLPFHAARRWANEPLTAIFARDKGSFQKLVERKRIKRVVYYPLPG